MTSITKPESPVQTVSISTGGLRPNGAGPSMPAPGLGRPKAWLGAKSPFGLAIPDAQPSSSTMYAPRGIWLDGQRLIVCDSGNHRILIWNAIPTEDQSPADVVLCQPGFSSEGPAAGGRGPENGVHLPTGVIIAEGKLLVADAWHHRILVWNEIPKQSDTPPDYAIGQASIEDVLPNHGENPSRQTLYWPYGIAWIDNRFYVADTGNRRVLAWEGLPTPGQPADVLLGQPSESASEENRGGAVAANSFRWPHDFAGVEGRLFVTDAGDHRVLSWDKPPTEDCPADAVLGQKDFSASYELPYDSQGTQRLRFPYAIDSCENILAVADTANNRILFWRVPLEESCYSSAYDVVGQIDFANNGENRWQSVNENTLCWPYGICFHQGTLAITDSGNNRVMLWDCQQIIDLANTF